MSSTMLNENLVVAMLGSAPSADHGEDLRTAALLVLLDAYDHKVTRPDFFQDGQDRFTNERNDGPAREHRRRSCIVQKQSNH